MNPLGIRTMTTAELAQSQDLACLNSIAAAARLEVDFEAEAARDWSSVWVLRPAPGFEPIAFLVAWFVADEVHIIDVATHPDARRQGAARSLVRTVIATAESRGARLVLLEVRESNIAAMALYRSLGFESVHVRRDYYSAPRENAVEMMLTLRPSPPSRPASTPTP